MLTALKGYQLADNLFTLDQAVLMAPAATASAAVTRPTVVVVRLQLVSACGTMEEVTFGTAAVVVAAKDEVFESSFASEEFLPPPGGAGDDMGGMKMSRR